MIIHTLIDIRKTRLLALSILVLISSCNYEYDKHFESEHSHPLSISSEYRISRDDDSLLTLPDKKVKYQIIDTINNAKNRIWIETYMWTDKDILKSVIDAHRRWVDVRIILERNVYDLPRVNIPILSELQKSWVPVKYADSYRFTFTHAKFWIIDDRYFISTWNFTRSFFESNRDFIFSGWDSESLVFLTQLFEWDFSYLWIDNGLIPNSIVLSPIDSRKKIEHLLGSAKKSIVIYNQTLTDSAILNILEDKNKQGIDIEICTADNESNKESSSWSELSWVTTKKPYLHGKVIIIDKDILFLWSQNLTKNSLENNREVGIISYSWWAVLGKIINSYNSDCKFD